MTRKPASTKAVSTNSGSDYTSLRGDISGLLREARIAAGRVVNTIVTATYWEIGRRIVEYEQKGEARAEYGAILFERIALSRKKAALLDGKGWGQIVIPLL